MSNMTIEKAIEYWKARYENTKYFDDVHCDADELREHKEYVEALKETITELEKQLPKKVKKEFVTVNGCITCFETDVCPVCGNDFYIEDLGQTMYYSFCPDCGQALDWSETDD